MADTVAIVSVVVTGVVSPIIGVIATRLQAQQVNTFALLNEYRHVLDDGADRLARLQRASSHCLSLWSRGVDAGHEEVRDQLHLRNMAGEQMMADYGRICIRFGPGSEVAQKYTQVMSQMQGLQTPLAPIGRANRMAPGKRELTERRSLFGMPYSNI